MQKQTVIRRVLLVEDDVVSGPALASILRRGGFEVTLVTTIADALQRLSNSCQFVLLDLMLPDGGGEVILRRIREQNLPICVIVTTAINDPHRLRAIRDLQPDLLLQKPIDVGRLLKGMAFKN